MNEHRLPFNPPFDSEGFAGFLAAHAVEGVDALDGRTYSRVVEASGDLVPLEIDLPGEGDEVTVVRLGGDPDLHGPVLAQVRQFLDLDADPAAVAEVLSADPVIGTLVAARPGIRVPGTIDPFQTAIFAVLGQQISLARARVLDARFHAEYSPDGVRFPTPAEVRALDPEDISKAIGMPRMRGRAIVGLAEEFARVTAGTSTVPSAGRDRCERLLAVPGIGPWTVDYLMLRSGSDPDAFVPGDLVLRRAIAQRTGREQVTPREAEALAERWRPCRAYALMQLWTATAYSGTPTAKRPPSPEGERPLDASD
jgi:3-methyladenine DNA glycosylase/8-oxoguanine DNA glycosylase